MEYLEHFSKITSVRLVLGTALMGSMLALLEHLPFTQSVIEFVLNMTGAA